MSYVKNFAKFVNESRAFSEKSDEVHAGQGQKANRYASKDPFTRDCSDLLSNLFVRNVRKEDWTEDLKNFNSHWKLDLPNPWISNEDKGAFMQEIESQEGREKRWTKEEFVKFWNSALTGVKESKAVNEATPNVREKGAKEKSPASKLRAKIKNHEKELAGIPKSAADERKRLKKKILGLRQELLALNEDTPNIGSKPKDPEDGTEDIDLNWDKMEPEARVEKLLAVVKDPDEAEKYAKLSWSALPSAVSANLSRV